MLHAYHGHRVVVADLVVVPFSGVSVRIVHLHGEVDGDRLRSVGDRGQKRNPTDAVDPSTDRRTYVRTYVKRTGTRTAAAERLETVKRFGTKMSLWGWLGWVRSIRVMKLLRRGASDDGFHRHELTGLHPAGAPSSMPSRRQNKFEYCRTIGRSTDRKVERQKGQQCYTQRERTLPSPGKTSKRAAQRGRGARTKSVTSATGLSVLFTFQLTSPQYLCRLKIQSLRR